MEIARTIESQVMELDQVEITTDHTIHGGIYIRTITMKKGTVLVGAEIMIPTSLIINGHLNIVIGGENIEFIGNHVISASAGRKQVITALEDSTLSMLFRTDAKTIEEAENEFTHEADRLMSRLPGAINNINITGE